MNMGWQYIGIFSLATQMQNCLPKFADSAYPDFVRVDFVPSNVVLARCDAHTLCLAG